MRIKLSKCLAPLAGNTRPGRRQIIKNLQPSTFTNIVRFITSRLKLSNQERLSNPQLKKLSQIGLNVNARNVGELVFIVKVIKTDNHTAIPVLLATIVMELDGNKMSTKQQLTDEINSLRAQYQGKTVFAWTFKKSTVASLTTKRDGLIKAIELKPTDPALAYDWYYAATVTGDYPK